MKVVVKNQPSCFATDKKGAEIDSLNVPFRGSFIKHIGNGSSTSFWDDRWLGDFKLRDKFQRLFRLARDKDAAVSERLIMQDDGLSTNWDWLRSPSGRTNSELTELMELLAGFRLKNDEPDAWRWALSSNSRFNVKDLTKAIDEYVISISGIPQETMRNNFVPKKVEIFVWRALKKRLPVKIELDKRGIDLHSVRCPLCDDDLESVDHSLIFCKHSLELWNRVFGWWKLGSFSNYSVGEILRGNAPVSMSVVGKKIWQAIEWICGYYIWKNRNNKVFRDKTWTTPISLNEIQIKSFEWISQRSKGRKLDWLTWLRDPNVYLHSL
ncbi:uncharacterized protein [Rutidosis leptorrhynchoides]|uniref:uncharacterized protein n=1 Tax=Rutidosis leptorrhynchoides TaxID=125765 RepID=UPI003A99E9B3